MGSSWVLGQLWGEVLVGSYGENLWWAKTDQINISMWKKKLILKNVTLKFEVDMLEKWEFLAGSSGGQFGGEILQGLFLLQKSKLPGRQITREPKHYPTC